MANPAIVEFKNATLKITDGTSPTALEMTLELGEGSFQYTEQTEIVYRRSRGNLNLVKEGDDIPVEVSFQADLDAITSVSASGDLTVMEVLTQRGEASSWVSTGAACEPYAVDIEITIDNQSCDASVNDEVYSFPQFRSTSRAVDMNAATIDIQGSCNVTTISSTRPTP